MKKMIELEKFFDDVKKSGDLKKLNYSNIIKFLKNLRKHHKDDGRNINEEL
jgi:hypothetical protein